MAWRMAKSLDQLLKQINEASPNRSKASDGSIGDAAHASRSSDHNPHVMDGKTGVVTARDFTHDPAHGIDSHKLALALIASRDKRIKYVISNGQIANSSATGGKPAWAWRPYSGANPHDKHVHISVKADKALYDDTSPWATGLKVTPTQAAKPAAKVDPVLKKGSKGAAVTELQKLLGLTGKQVDGVFGKGTEAAVKTFQKARGLVADGVVGTYTWDALRTKIVAKTGGVEIVKASTEPVVAVAKPQKFIGGLVAGIAVDALTDVVKGAVERMARDPDTSVIRRDVPDIVETIVREVAPVVADKVAPQAQAQVDAVVENATNNEPWYKSRVILGAGVGLASMVAGLVGIQLDAVDQSDIVTTGLQIIGGLGAAFALYGRIRAKNLKPLGE